MQAEDPGRVRAELQKPYEKLKEVAKRIATVYSECKIDIDIDEYVAKFKPGIMEVCDFLWMLIYLCVGHL